MGRGRLKHCSPGPRSYGHALVQGPDKAVSLRFQKGRRRAATREEVIQGAFGGTADHFITTCSPPGQECWLSRQPSAFGNLKNSPGDFSDVLDLTNTALAPGQHT
jgi:hypothetical protein